MIDICDLAVGLSRQLFGRTIASERPGHRMLETWHPLGPVARDHAPSTSRSPCGAGTRRSRSSAAIRWSGSRASARRSPRSPARRSSGAPPRRSATRPTGLLEVVIGGADRARQLADGSAPAARLGDRLDGHGQGARAARRRPPRPLAARARRQQRAWSSRRAPISTWPCAPSSSAPSAPPASAARALRRLIVHESIADELCDRLERAYASVPVGDPREAGTLCGPLISRGLVRPPAGRARARARRRRQRSAAASACSPTSTPTRSTSAPRSCACRRRPRSCATRRSRRSSTR